MTRLWLCWSTRFTSPRNANDEDFNQGLTTIGHKTIVLGFFELNIAENRDVALGELSTIWTDGHKSYKWLCQGVQRGYHSLISGYTWNWVNHKNGHTVRGSGVERVFTTVLNRSLVE